MAPKIHKTTSFADIKAKQQGSAALADLKKTMHAKTEQIIGQTNPIGTGDKFTAPKTGYNNGPKSGIVESEQRAAKVMEQNQKKLYEEKIQTRKDLKRSSRNPASKIETVSPKEAKEFVKVQDSKIKVDIPESKITPTNSAEIAAKKAAKTAAKKGLMKTIGRAMPVVGAVVSVAMEVPDLIDAHKNGGFKQQVVKSGGGMAGATGGAALGAQIGTVGGPIGMLVGGAIGGVIGYLAGSKVGEKIGELAFEERKSNTPAESNATATDCPISELPTASQGPNTPITLDPESKKAADEKKAADAAKAANPAPIEVGKKNEDGIYGVKKGDNIWNIVKKTFPELKTDAQILEMTKKIIEKNGLDNEKHQYGNLIYPMDRIDLNVA